MQPMGFLTILEILIGIYLIYAAIRGKGKLYENDYLNCPREQYVRTMRIMAAVTGVIMLGTAVVEMLGIVGSTSAMGWLLWALTFGSIVVMMIYTVKKTDRKAAAAGRSTSPEKKDYDPLRAAFVFDDEEEQAGE
ncbi:MAG: hypothetical protein IJN83_01280 [Clostridia bacterium]|nr:hypothetical protein [Clostridia bacterium]MBQ6704163.1 hypothetical protein [Clostridia bacterium]MBQ7091270.1 hypothetical protein [Clostridia bacterium]